MILGLDAPVVVVPARAAALLARPLGRLVADARRRGETVDDCVLDALADFERLRRALVAQAGSAPGTAEPESAEPFADCDREPALSTQEAADLLGCSTSYLRRRARDQRIAIKVGSAWRFPVAEVVALRDGTLT